MTAMRRIWLVDDGDGEDLVVNELPVLKETAKQWHIARCRATWRTRIDKGLANVFADATEAVAYAVERRRERIANARESLEAAGAAVIRFTDANDKEIKTPLPPVSACGEHGHGDGKRGEV